MKVLYSSIAVGEMYGWFAYNCLSSFKELNTEPVDWEIQTDSKESIKYFKDLLSPLEDEKLHFIYSLMPEAYKEVDVNKYITLGWTPYKSACFFIDRIKHIEDLKNQGKYDILVTVDFDSVFRRDPSELVKAFIESNKTYGGAREPYDIATSYKMNNKGRYFKTNKTFKYESYFNLGMGLLNLRKLPDNIWNTFKEMSKDCEELFNVQDQSFFCYLIPEEEKCILDDAQLVAHLLWKREYRIKRNPYLIHFSPRIDLMFGRFKADDVNPYQIVKIKYYHIFAKYALQNKHLLPADVIDNINFNLKFISFIYKYKPNVIKILENVYRI